MADGSIIIDTQLNSDGLKNGLGSLGSVASSAMKGITVAVGAVSTALVGVGGFATKVGMEFEASMSQVAATMGMSAEEIRNGSKEFEMLEEAAKQAGATTQFSASQSAEALNYLALAGYDAEKACEALPKVLNLAAAGGLDLAYASDLVTDSMAALGLEMDELDSFMDKMAKTAQKSNTSVAQLGEATLTVGGTAKTLSGGVTEMNTALGILADVGIKGSEGGTALRNVILSLTAPTDKAAGALENLGVVVSDEQGNMRELEEIFTDLNSSMTGLGTVAKQQILNEIFNKVDLKAVSGLMAATVVDMGSLNESINKLGIDAEKNADMITYLAATFEVGEDKAEFCNYAIQEMGITAEQASGMYDSLNAAVQNGSNRFDELSGYIENAEGACATMADTMNDNLKGRITELESATEGLGIQIYEHMELPLKSAAEAGIEAIGQLSSALETGGFSAMAEAIGDVLAQGISKIAEYAPQIVQMAVSIIQAFVQGINDSLPEILSAAVSIIGSLATGILELVPTLIEIGGQILQQLATSIIENAPQMFEIAQETLTYLLDGFIANIDSILETGMEILITLTEGIKDTLPELIPVAIGALIAFAESVLDNIDTVLECGIDIILAIVEGIVNALPQLIDKVPEIINAFWDAFDKALVKILECGVKIILKLGEGILKNLGTIKDNAGEIVAAIFNTIMHLDMISMGKTLIKNLGNGLKSMGTSIKNSATELVDTLKRPFTDSISKFSEIGKNIIQGIINGIKNMASNVTGAIGEICNSAISSAKKFLGIHSPSRVFRDDVGKQIGAGMSIGIESTEDLLKKTMVGVGEKLIDAAIDTSDKIRILEKEQQQKLYREKEKIGLGAIENSYQKYMRAEQEKINQKASYIKGIEDKIAAQKEILDTAKMEAKVKSQYDKLTKLELQQITNKSSKKAALELQKLEDVHGKISLAELEQITKANEAKLNKEKEAIEERKSVLEDYKDAYAQVYEQIISEYEKAYDVIMKKQESLEEKLKSFGDLFDKVTVDGEEIFQLGDLEDDIANLLGFGAALEELKRRGVSQDFIDELLSINMEDALKFTDLLLEQTEKDFNNYIRLWEEKQRVSESIAQNFYKDQFDTLKTDFTDQINKQMGLMPDESRKIGLETSRQLAEGIKSGKGMVFGAVNEILSHMNEMVNNEMTDMFSKFESMESYKANSNVRTVTNDQGINLSGMTINNYGDTAYHTKGNARELGRQADLEMRRRGIRR